MVARAYVLEAGDVQRPLTFDGVLSGGVVRPVYEPDPEYATGTRLARLWPFKSSDPANVSMGDGATFEADTDTITADFLSSAAPYVNRENWSFKIVQASLSDPLAQVTDPTEGDAVVATIRVPSNTQPTGGTDKHVGIISPDGHTIDEFYAWTYVSDTHYETTFNLTNDLNGTALLRGVRASGTSFAWGIIRAEELADFDIPHTLVIGLDDDDLKQGFVWPARSEDGDAGSAYTGEVPMGTMFAIPPGTSMPGGLTASGQALFTCLQDFGGHIMVRAAECELFAEPSCDTNLVNDLRTDWPDLRDLMRRVTNNTSNNIAGGGTRRRAAAPEVYNPMHGSLFDGSLFAVP